MYHTQVKVCNRDDYNRERAPYSVNYKLPYVSFAMAPMWQHDRDVMIKAFDALIAEGNNDKITYWCNANPHFDDYLAHTYLKMPFNAVHMAIHDICYRRYTSPATVALEVTYECIDACHKFAKERPYITLQYSRVYTEAIDKGYGTSALEMFQTINKYCYGDVNVEILRDILMAQIASIAMKFNCRRTYKSILKKCLTEFDYINYTLVKPSPLYNVINRWVADMSKVPLLTRLRFAVASDNVIVVNELIGMIMRQKKAADLESLKYTQVVDTTNPLAFYKFLSTNTDIINLVIATGGVIDITESLNEMPKNMNVIFAWIVTNIHMAPDRLLFKLSALNNGVLSALTNDNLLKTLDSVFYNNYENADFFMNAIVRRRLGELTDQFTIAGYIVKLQMAPISISLNRQIIDRDFELLMTIGSICHEYGIIKPWSFTVTSDMYQHFDVIKLLCGEFPVKYDTVKQNSIAAGLRTPLLYAIDYGAVVTNDDIKSINSSPYRHLLASVV